MTLGDEGFDQFPKKKSGEKLEDSVPQIHLNRPTLFILTALPSSQLLTASFDNLGHAARRARPPQVFCTTSPRNAWHACADIRKGLDPRGLVESLQIFYFIITHRQVPGTHGHAIRRA